MPRRIPRLERKFGLFHCKCNPESKWSSAHVYCVYGTKKVYFKQKCQNCKSPINPYRVWNLQCADCGLDRDECECICIYCEEHRYDCTCDLEDETAPEKPHRRDLCMKCLAGFPCITESDDHVPRRRRRRRRRRR